MLRFWVVLVVCMIGARAHGQASGGDGVVYSSYRGHGSEIRRFSLDSSWPTSAVAPNDPASAEQKPALGMIEQWLEREITTKCPGVRRVWFEQSTVRTYSSMTDQKSVGTNCIVDGTEATFTAVDGLLRGLAAQNQVLITVKQCFVAKPIKQRPEGRPSVSLIGKSKVPVDAQASPMSKHEAPANVLLAPNLTVFQGQLAHTQITRNVSFVTNYELASVQDRVIANPIISTIGEGYQTSIRALVNPDGSTVSISIDILTESVRWPVGERSFKLGEQVVTVQVPDVTSTTWSSGILDLRADEQALDISDLSFVDAESHELKSLQVILDLSIDAGGMRGLAKVVAFDDRSKLLVAEASPEAAIQVGASLMLSRGSRVFGNLVVERIEGKIVFARYEGNEKPQVGDFLMPKLR